MIGDPVAVSREATETSVTPLKTRRNVSRGMASSSAPISGRKRTWNSRRGRYFRSNREFNQISYCDCADRGGVHAD